MNSILIANNDHPWLSRRAVMKREIEFCNWTTFIERGGEPEGMPADLAAWFDRLQESRQAAVQQLAEGAVMVSLLHCLYNRFLCVAVTF